ncbi:aminopeptidase [Acinetobacter sp. NCu2D-2]|uniref:M20/M25/M40 family metallo-hydrolase n=1 Tax=Acinetobacter sp. NCu2D-2 TaxID=1608473 RepID=UPI0007CDF88E|nr:aminopeptidase [Acinetobacter sp. NCu2D-2]
MHIKVGVGTLLMLALGIGVSGCTTEPMQQDLTMAQQLAVRDGHPIMKHLYILQAIAQENGGNRAVGTAGGQATAKYILDEAKKAELTAQMLPFENRNKIVGQNIIVEIQGQSKNTAIIVGGHYDSVKMGPGINDNGSGVAVLLELMHHYAKTKPKHTVYLAFWDSEEDGIGGSKDFVSQLTETQLKGIQAYINIDMVGTKNPTIQIADGDHSSIDDMEKMLKARGMKEAEYKPLTDGLRKIPKHAGDLALEQQMKAFFKTKGIEVKEDVSTLAASDTAPFLGKVPVTSLILFNEQMKGDELEFAPCYHKACDTIELIDPKSLQLSLEAVKDLMDHLNQ